MQDLPKYKYTNLQLLMEVIESEEKDLFLNPRTFQEIQIRGLSFLFNKTQTRQSIYDEIKIRNIDVNGTRT